MLIDEYEAFGEMRIGRGNQSMWRKHFPLPLCPSQTPHDIA
jgi:hypothetical protein